MLATLAKLQESPSHLMRMVHTRSCSMSLWESALAFVLGM